VSGVILAERSRQERVSDQRSSSVSGASLPSQDAIFPAPAGSGQCTDLHGYQSLLGILKDVPDPRRRCGIRHRAAVVLAFGVAAVLAGADSVTAVSEWAADVPAEVLPHLVPCRRAGAVRSPRGSR
jgi:hypothetical protein